MNADELRAWRKTQRAQLVAARAALVAEERAEANARIEGNLATVFADRRGGVVAGYWPVAGEFDVLPFLERLRAQGAVTALPAIVEKNAPLAFRAWRFGDPLASGVYGIAHPESGEAVQPDALIVPLLGFDDSGARLGFGAGYYDRTLAVLSPKPFCVGVGYAHGRLATIHPQPHDVPMDAIVTETGILRSAR